MDLSFLEDGGDNLTNSNTGSHADTNANSPAYTGGGGGQSQYPAAYESGVSNGIGYTGHLSNNHGLDGTTMTMPMAMATRTGIGMGMGMIERLVRVGAMRVSAG